MIYGNPRPPAYNLTNVRAPISIMVGPGDYHATPKDAKRLARMLPNVVDFYPVKYAFWRHLDFCYAKVSFDAFDVVGCCVLIGFMARKCFVVCCFRESGEWLMGKFSSIWMRSLGLLE